MARYHITAIRNSGLYGHDSAKCGDGLDSCGGYDEHYLGDAPTAEQIRTLRTEALEAGDAAQSELCDRALDGDREAVGLCWEAMDAARE